MLQSLGTVSTLLTDLLYISFAVPSSRLRALVPSILPFQTMGRGEIFVSLVVMRNTDVGPVWLPWPRQHYNQMNIRTYVQDPLTGNHGVFFLKSGITSLSALVIPRMLGLPWEKIDLRIRTDVDSFGTYHYRAVGDFHGHTIIKVRGLAQQQGRGPSATIRDAAVHITAPNVGFAMKAGTRQKLLSFGVEHQFVEPVCCELVGLQVPLLEELGIVKEEEMDKPHSVFLVPEVKFLVRLPPRRVAQARETR